MSKRACISRVMQDRAQRSGRGFSPKHFARIKARNLAPGNLQIFLGQERQDFLNRAQLHELVEHQMQSLLNAQIGIEHHRLVQIADQARRQVLHQLAPRGLRQSTRVQSQSEAMESAEDIVPFKPKRSLSLKSRG